MAVYFSVDKTSGNMEGTIRVTPLTTFKGRGPVSNTVIVKSKDDPTIMGSTICTKINPLSRGIVVVQGAASPNPSVFEDVETTEEGNVVIPNTSYYLKFAVSETNAKKIYVGVIPEYLSIRIGSQYIQTDGTMGVNQSNIATSIVGNMVIIPNDPGLSAEFPCEITVGFSANQIADTREIALTLMAVGSTDSERLPIYDGKVSQSPASPTLMLSPESLTWGADDMATKEITIISNDEWDVYIV